MSETANATNDTSINNENAPNAPTTGAKRGPKPMPRDPVTGKIIRPVDVDGNLIVRQRKTKQTNNNAQ